VRAWREEVSNERADWRNLRAPWHDDSCSRASGSGNRLGGVSKWRSAATTRVGRASSVVYRPRVATELHAKR
jgi:hypothetical protein